MDSGLARKGRSVGAQAAATPQPPPPPQFLPQPPLQPPRPPQIGPQNNVEDLPTPDKDTPKRKIKLKDFEENSVVRTTPAAGRPSKYALKKLTEFEYIELYYFTIEACRDTALRETKENVTYGGAVFTSLAFKGRGGRDEDMVANCFHQIWASMRLPYQVSPLPGGYRGMESMVRKRTTAVIIEYQ